MNIESILSPSRTFCRVDASSKKKAIEMASHLIAGTLPSLAEGDIYSALMAREKVSPTSLGYGIALPHCRLASCEAVTGALITLKQPVDYGSIDDEPVNILFVLLVPESETEQHLKTMAMLVERFEQASYRSALKSARSDQELFELATSSRNPGTLHTAQR